MSRKISLCLLILSLSFAVFAQESVDDILPITEDIQYSVRPSDTLDTIGSLFDVSPTCLAEMNEIERGEALQIGQTLLISVSCPLYGDDARDLVFGVVDIPREVVRYEDDCEGYRVQRNDSLDLIGFDLDISLQSLAIANDLTAPYVLEINQCLVIPEDAPPWGTFPAIATDSEDIGTGGGIIAGEIYVMQPRDTLDVIARQFDVSVVSLQLANNISKPFLIQPGTSIVIPEDAPAYGVFPAIEEPIAGELYTVQEGDTLASIAEAFNVAETALVASNSSDEITEGQVILIPSGVPAFGMDESFDPASLGQGGGFAGQTHVVQPRETLDLIGARYDVDSGCLAETNGIQYPPLMQPGTVLIIYESCPDYQGYAIPPLSESIRPVDGQ